MTKIKQIAEGVYQASSHDGLTMLWGEMEWLVNIARATPKKRARICLHQPDDNMHQMLIVLMKETYLEQHAHKGVESQYLIQGHGYIESDGVLQTFDQLTPLYFARPGVMHKTVVNSEYMILLESKERE